MSTSSDSDSVPTEYHPDGTHRPPIPQPSSNESVAHSKAMLHGVGLLVLLDTAFEREGLRPPSQYPLEFSYNSTTLQTAWIGPKSFIIPKSSASANT